MSDVPKARGILQEMLLKYGAEDISPRARREITRALALMTREKAARRAPSLRQPIDKEMRLKVRTLWRTTNLTSHQIANRVGLRNSGRISEIVHGKR